MKLSSLAIVFAFTPLALAAQSPAPGLHTPAFNSGCPVSMQLQQRLGNQLQTVRNDGRTYKGPATQLMLTVGELLSPDSSPSFRYGVAHNEALDGKTNASPVSRHGSLRAASATATAYGYGGQPRAELISPGQNAAGKNFAGPTRNLQLRFDANDGSSVAELWLPGFGAVRWLDLDSITWANGSVWTPAKGQSCTVRPSLFMLVGADSQVGR